MQHKLITGLIGIWLALSCVQVHASGYPAAMGGPTPSPDDNDEAGPNTPDPKDDASSAECEGGAGGTIQLVNGSERFSITDLELKGLFPIRLTRQYESRATYDSALGFGWDFTFVRRLYTYNDPDKDVFTDTAKPGVISVQHHVVRHGCGRKDLWIQYVQSSCVGGITIIEGTPVASGARRANNLPSLAAPSGGSGGSTGGGSGCSGTTAQIYLKAFGSISNQFNGTTFREISAGITNYFDTQGKLTEQRNEQGHAHRYTYDARGLLPLVGVPAKGVDLTRPRVVAKDYRLTHIEEYAADGISTGNFVDFIYNDSSGRLTQITASDGRVVNYTHDLTTNGLTLGNLLQVDAPGNKTSVYKYEDTNDLHNITSIQEDANEAPWVNTYNADDRAIQQIRQLDTGRYAYINIDYASLYTNTVVRKSLRDATSALLPGTTEITETTWFDAQWMKPNKMEDANGHCVKNTYDSNGNASSKAYYAVNCAAADAGAMAVKTLETVFDLYGRLLTEKINLGNDRFNKRDWLYDATQIGNGAVTGQSYTPVSDGASNNPGWEQIIQGDASSTTIISDIFYGRDSVNTNTSIVAAELQRTRTPSSNGQLYDLATHYQHDTKNRLTAVIQDGHEIRTSYENGSLFPTRVAHIKPDTSEDATRLTRYAYDTRGNVKDQWDANNNHTAYEYDDRNRLIKITNALNEETILTYTGTYLTQVEIGRTATTNGWIRTLGYDGQGNINHVQEQDDNGVLQTVFTGSYDAHHHLLSATDGMNRTWQYQYDNAGNLVREQDPELHITEHGYDALRNRVWTRNANLQQTNYGYDPAGRLIRIEQCGQTPCAVTQIEYDAMDRVTAVVDANNNRSQYTYDLAGRLTQQTGAKGLQQYSYDSRNRLIQWLNARGQKTEFNYYSWGGLQTSSDYPDATSTIATRSVTRTYDNQGNPQNITDTAVQATQLRSQNYDALNRLATEYNYHVPNKTISKTYAYDALGNIQTLTLNDGSTQTQNFHHNKRNWLDTATLLSNPYTFNYYNDGREQSRSQASRTRNHTYYNNGWLQNITDSVSNNAQLTQGFTPDAVGNITTINKLIGAQTELNNFGYDGLNRLTTASNPTITGLNSSESYTYDATGNRQSFTYDNWNRITTALGKSYAYDADGNPNNIGGVTLTHDQDGRLTQYGFNQYSYDPEWRRIKKVTANSTRYYVWDQGKLLAEYDQTSARKVLYAYLPGEYSPSEVSINNIVYQVRTDHLGTPLELVNAQNNVVWRAHYESFGNAVINNDVDGDGTPVQFNVRMPGQYYDSETGLNYNVARYYSTETGRYLQSDPIGLEGGINTFAYVENNPLLYIDPTGENLAWTWEAGWAIGTAAVRTPWGRRAIAWGVDAAWDAMHSDADSGDDADDNGDDNDESESCPSTDKDNWEKIPKSNQAYSPKGEKEPVFEKDRAGDRSHGDSAWKKWDKRKSWEQGRYRDGTYDTNGRRIRD